MPTAQHPEIAPATEAKPIQLEYIPLPVSDSSLRSLLLDISAFNRCFDNAIESSRPCTMYEIEVATNFSKDSKNPRTECWLPQAHF